MTEKNQDIYGKIDALLEKRDADILGERGSENDDFPRLTEVIGSNSGMVWHGTERRISGQVTDGRRSVDRRNSIRQKPQVGEFAINSFDGDLNGLLVVIEQRLADVISRQHLQLKIELLRVIREELSAIGDEKI